MVKRIEGMPPGTIGLEASGELSKADYSEVMEPALREALESGEIRMLFRLTDFKGLGHGAWFEDLKTGLGLGYGHHSAWKRSAIVTDVEWVAKAYALFTWVTPGEVQIFDLGQIDEARDWVAA